MLIPGDTSVRQGVRDGAGLLVVLGGLVVLAGAAVGWLLPDRNEYGSPAHNVPAQWERPIGAAALGLGVLTVVALAVRFRGRPEVLWLTNVIVPLSIAAMLSLCGFRWSMLDSVGADIGGGLVLLVGVPTIVGLVGFAAVRAGSFLTRGLPARRAPKGWYRDPDNPTQSHYWNGRNWLTQPRDRD
jgi:hypothetical protein